MPRLLSARANFLPGLEGRHDVEKGETFDAPRVIECEPITDPRAPIMAGESETRHIQGVPWPR